MARREFPIGAPQSETGGFLEWSANVLNERIPDEFLVIPDTDYLANLSLNDGGNGCGFRLSDSATDTIGGIGDTAIEMTAAWENYAEAFTIEAGGLSITFRGPNHSDNSNQDFTSPYSFNFPSTFSSEFSTFANAFRALSASQKAATVLILDDGVPVEIDVTPSTLTGVAGTIAATVEIQEAPLELSDWTQPDNTDLVFAGLWEAGGSGINIYRSPENGGTARGSFLEGTRELLAGQNVERIRSITAGLRLNDQPSAADLLAFFDVGGDGEGGTFYLVTEDGEYTSVAPSIGGGGNANNIVFTVSG